MTRWLCQDATTGWAPSIFTLRVSVAGAVPSAMPADIISLPGRRPRRIRRPCMIVRVCGTCGSGRAPQLPSSASVRHA
jgi:hypothetical protein